MKESKDFRSGTRLLQWEKEKLSMEYEDLQMKWTEIQQTKVKQLIKNTIGNSDKSNNFVLIWFDLLPSSPKKTGMVYKPVNT